ncbi:MAG: Fic family protein [Planctomycetota bacterium]|jgi:Fic family protein
MAKKKELYEHRAGQYQSQPGGYRAFIPKPLPPDPPIVMDEELAYLLSLADRAVGRLDASTDNVPDPDFFVYGYVLREAAPSSQIEGTVATIDDVFNAQAQAPAKPKTPDDVDEIVNYVDAMNYGLDRQKKDNFPLSLRLIREIHAKLLKGVRGEHREPGRFRRDQNWIGPKGCTLETATFVPPPANQIMDLLTNMEKFIHDQDRVLPLIKTALIHAQFETIHPFRDGNGRIGRLLITLFLCQQTILRRPLLYLSHYFKANRPLYYESLQAIRDTGNWEIWIKFFLRGVHSVAKSATETARDIISLQENDRRLIESKLGQASGKALELLHKLYRRPFVSPKNVTDMINVTPATANNLIRKFVELGILHQRGQRKRNRIFSYQKYYDLLAE